VSCRALILPLLLLLAGEVTALQEQVATDRFAGWDSIRSTDWVFDPDDRPVLGFSVRDSQAARSAIDDVESLLNDGEVEQAARDLLSVIADFGDQVVQVDGDNGRWMGAAEWALHLLRTRVPDGVRADLAGPAPAEEIAAAAAWRDTDALRRLAVRFDGTPEARRALAWAARLAAERGDLPVARAAAQRALAIDAGEDLDELMEALAVPGRIAAVREVRPPESLEYHWKQPLVVSRVGRRNPFAHSPGISEAPIAPVVPVVEEGVVYIADSVSVYAFDLLSGRELWRHAGPMEAIALDPNAHRDVFRFDYYMDDWRPRAVSPYLHAKPSLGPERLYAAVQVAEPLRELHRLDNIPINYPLPRRRLVALDRATGELLWQQERPGLGELAFRNRFDVAGPPMLMDGVLYVAGTVTDGAVNSYIAAFDPEDGELIWHTFLCAGQQDLTMFNRPFQEHTSSPALAADGSIFVSSNLGVVACVDAFSGRVRWLTGYEPTARRASRSPDRDQRRDIYWTNHPPVLEAGRLLVTPLDNSRLLALDPATGRTVYELDALWRNGGSLRHEVIGTGDGRMLVAGDQRVECFDASDGRMLWSTGLQSDINDYIIGSATLSDGHLLLPAQSGLLEVDLAADGELRRREWESGLGRRGVRRVTAAGPVLLMIDNWYLYAAVDLERALEDALERASDSQVEMLAAAELLLSAGQFSAAETFFDRLLPDAQGAMAVRARSGRLEAALRAARTVGTRERWEALLETARRLDASWEVAPEALVGLDIMGADDATREWLDELAASDPERVVDLGPLTPDGEQPVGLIAALRHLDRDTPAAAVERLQGLIARWPHHLWDGVPVREAATRRIAQILSAHGRGLYEEFERAAEDALDRVDDATSLLAVEERYPNARAVADARLSRLAVRLSEGFALEVFEELSGASMLDADAELLALRERAARALGEDAYADVLAGRAPVASAPRLPALPSGDFDLTSYEISKLGKVSFPPITGRASPEYDGCVLGAVNLTGDLFLLDTQGEGVLWRNKLPKDLAFASAGLVDFAQLGNRLFIEVFNERLIEARSMDDGEFAWGRGLPGDSRSLVVAGGLVLRLHTRPDDGGRRFAVTGYGAASGAEALSVDLPPCVDARLFTAGEHVVVFTAGDLRSDGTMVDARLSLLDIVHGALEDSVVLPGASPTVVLTLDEPPTVLLSERASTGGSGTRLLAWDPVTREVTWQSDRLAGVVTRQVLYPAGDARLLLFESGAVRSLPSGEMPPGAVLTPIDARDGPGLPMSAGEPVSILGGQSVGRAPRLVMKSVSDPGRLVVADARGAGTVTQLSLPRAVTEYARVTHARDGFLLTSEPLVPGADATLTIFDGDTGEQRYSTVLDDLRARGRTEMTLAEGAVVLANGGTIRVVHRARGTDDSGTKER
jgi:outer membrane protein assembly factor BamB